MKKQLICESEPTPTVNIAVNKSRIKLYNKNGEMPTYYLQSGQEFQIEIFNPTSNVVLAKITLNNKLISQGGLVLNPGQRVFLDRYLDVAKKFKFDTYEVSNTNEVKKAIKNNGDVKVQFFNEISYFSNGWVNTTTYNAPYTQYPSLTVNGTATNGTATIGTVHLTSNILSPTPNTVTYYSNSINDTELSFKSNKIETGRVEEGSKSDQKFETVNNNFSGYAFHTVEYKLLPISQKINTEEDINVKRYCTNCAHKLKKEYKYCPVCATKI